MQHISPLLTDLCQINMIQAYLDHGDTETAVFEMFVRTLPPRRGFLMAAGLEQALDFRQNLRFSADEIAWLGFGLENLISPCWTVKAEYEHLDFDDKSMQPIAACVCTGYLGMSGAVRRSTTTLKSGISIVKAGLSYKLTDIPW